MAGSELSAGLWLLAAAAAAGPAQPPLAQEERVLPRIVDRSCRGDGDEIVVCGRRDPGRYRLRDQGLQASDDAGQERLGVDLAPGVRAEVDALTVARPDGLVDKRVMVHFKFKF